MEHARLKFLFHRYIGGACTEAERTEFLELIREEGNRDQVKQLIDLLWTTAPEKRLDSDRSDIIIDAILVQAKGNDHSATGSFPWMKIAASLLFAVLSIAGAFYFYHSGAESLQADHTSEPAKIPEAARFIKLPDGSTVILNAGSALEYPPSFSGNTREVHLTGEGYFDIAHDVERPFIVYTGKLRTTVLGTAFNIKAYPGQTDITVTVTRGKVKVSDERKVLGIVNPDQQFTFNTTRDYVEQKEVDSHRVTAWMEKDIFFDDITIADAIDQLEKRFDITINLANKTISDCRFTATFVKGENVEQILRILCDFNNATLQAESPGVFLVEGGRCPL